MVDPTTALSTHVSETIRSVLPDLLSRQQTKELVDRVGQTSPRLIEELVPKIVSIGDVQRVLRQLLRERVPVRDLVTILEAIGDAASGAGATKDPDAITEAVRTTMGRAICRPFQNDRGELPAISLAPTLESQLVSAIVRTDHGPVLALEPSHAQRLATKIAEALAGAVAQPVLLCTPTLRPHLWRLLTRVLPHLGVVSHNEVPSQLQIATVAVSGLTTDHASESDYRSPNVRDAPFRAARENELGADAALSSFSTTLVQARGWRGWFGLREIELTAGAERAPSGAQRSAERPAERAAERLIERPVERAVERLRERAPGTDEIAARLSAGGLDPSMAEEIALGLSPKNRRGASLHTLHAALATRLSPLAAEDDEYARVEVFIGPPGVGKTTTIAKIAAQERARRGRKLGLIAADGFRIERG